MMTNRPRSFKHSMVVEIGLSDFHKMCVTVMKTHYNKEKPLIVKYRKFKIFSNDAFLKDLKSLLSKFDNEKNPVPVSSLKEAVNRTLEKHAPFNEKYVTANQIPFINKTLSKEIMNRSRLRNKFLNTKSEIDRKEYKKQQRNYIVSLMRKKKRIFLQYS